MQITYGSYLLCNNFGNTLKFISEFVILQYNGIWVLTDTICMAETLFNHRIARNLKMKQWLPITLLLWISFSNDSMISFNDSIVFLGSSMMMIIEEEWWLEFRKNDQIYHQSPFCDKTDSTKRTSTCLIKRGTYEFDRIFLVPVWCVVVALWSREFYISGDWDRSGYESGNSTSQWNCGVCYFVLIPRRYVHYLKSWCLQWFLTSGILNQVSYVYFLSFF